jgi:putative RNA 2'-phosphotransferase
VGKRNHQIKVENLSRFLLYILGRRPDEFGLVPGKDGFVKYKELLQAIHEEPGWGYVRQSHINEVLLGKDRPLFQIEDNHIRALERKWQLELNEPVKVLPGILYTAVRKRAHPVAMEKGLTSTEGRYLVLSPNKSMALRIGRRRDPKPVLLEVMTGTVEKQRISFYAFGDLFVSLQIAARFISGPPVPKEDMERRGDAEVRKEKALPKQTDFAPGTFSLDISRDPDLHRRAKGKKRKGWKEDARRIRRRKKR